MIPITIWVGEEQIAFARVHAVPRAGETLDLRKKGGLPVPGWKLVVTTVCHVIVDQEDNHVIQVWVRPAKKVARAVEDRD